MGRIATAVHALKNKNIYLSIKEKIPTWLDQTKMDGNPEIITVKIMPALSEAFDNGLEFQQALFKRIFKIRKFPKISNAEKYKIIKECLKLLILKINTASDRYNSKIDEIIKLIKIRKMKINPIKTTKSEWAWNEYCNAVKSAVNACIIDVGRAAGAYVLKQEAE